MIQRIMGIETEYGVACSDFSGAHVDRDVADVTAQIFADMQARTGATSAFLGNGGRLYLDIGDHPEYATAECTQLADVLAQDRAGDQMLAQMALDAEPRLSAPDAPVRVHLFKNNVDAASHSYGCHENYLVRRRRFYGPVERFSAVFRVAPVVSGGGLRSSGTGHSSL